MDACAWRPSVSKPELITDQIIDLARSLIPLAPLHNPANIDGIEVARKLLPNVPHVAVNSPIIVGEGREPKVVGAAFGLKQGAAQVSVLALARMAPGEVAAPPPVLPAHEYA